MDNGDDDEDDDGDDNDEVLVKVGLTISDQLCALYHCIFVISTTLHLNDTTRMLSWNMADERTMIMYCALAKAF